MPILAVQCVFRLRSIGSQTPTDVTSLTIVYDEAFSTAHRFSLMNRIASADTDEIAPKTKRAIS
ncbi:hypothetical protein L686_16710 [Stutzerimonas stutzeri MF28]|nr:hypothetical protein L686_16710 [Stutzerimonas stutzeri MF28]